MVRVVHETRCSLHLAETRGKFICRLRANRSRSNGVFSPIQSRSASSVGHAGAFVWPSGWDELDEWMKADRREWQKDGRLIDSGYQGLRGLIWKFGCLVSAVNMLWRRKYRPKMNVCINVCELWSNRVRTFDVKYATCGGSFLMEFNLCVGLLFSFVLLMCMCLCYLCTHSIRISDE